MFQNLNDDEGGGEPSEDEYDALNDETFGQGCEYSLLSFWSRWALVEGLCLIFINCYSIAYRVRARGLDIS